MRRLPLHEPRGEEHHRTKGLVRVTMACNERCPFCNVPVEDYAEPTPSEEEVQRELDAFVASGERTLTLSGGEPTLLRQRLLKVIREARSRGVLFVELQTNAILIDERYADELVKAGLTSAFVSLLSDVKALHDELAGLAGAFELCLRGIDALLDAGIAVTLNPVIARLSQTRVASYIDFVHERLPRVTSISLSAVQPHGRAARSPELMPDYDVLAAEIRRAQERARAHGLLVVNPYCGLPLCVGWDQALDRSVEAIEAQVDAGGPFGIDNLGNKRHGAPCRGCALRTRCGGAWHAYWGKRGGRGISPPISRRDPWRGCENDGAHTFVVSRAGLSPVAEERLRAASTPTVWLVSETLNAGDAARLLDTRCTDLAILVETPSALTGSTLLELTALAATNERRLAQSVVRAALGLRRLGSFSATWAAIEAAAKAGVTEMRLFVAGDERHAKLARAAARQFPSLTLSVG